MNITLLVNHDLASCFAVNLLKPIFASHNVTLFVSSKVGGVTTPSESLQMLRFFEQTLFNEMLTPLLLSQDVTDKKQGFKPLEYYSNGHLHSLNHINTPEGIVQLRQNAPDLIISIRFGRILKQAALSVPRLGTLNLHSGILPDYRGVMASFWAMLHGESQLGTSLHWINDDTIDTGDIVAQSLLPVDATKSYLWHVIQLYFGGCEKILQAVECLSQGQTLSSKAQSGIGRYFTFPTTSDFAQFQRQNLCLVDPDEIKELISYYFLAD